MSGAMKPFFDSFADGQNRRHPGGEPRYPYIDVIEKNHGQQFFPQVRADDDHPQEDLVMEMQWKDKGSSGQNRSDHYFEFQVMEKVKYWSETHKQWMDAVIENIIRDENGQVSSYDLDVKKMAKPSKLRRTSSEAAADAERARLASEKLAMNQAPHYPNPDVDVQAKVIQDLQAKVNQTADYWAGNAHNGKDEAKFKVNDTVEYWSDTFSTWMSAVVNNVNYNQDGTVTYDLNVKQGAQAHKVRSCNAGQDSGRPKTPRNARPKTADQGYVRDVTPARGNNEQDSTPIRSSFNNEQDSRPARKIFGSNEQDSTPARNASAAQPLMPPQTLAAPQRPQTQISNILVPTPEKDKGPLLQPPRLVPNAGPAAENVAHVGPGADNAASRVNPGTDNAPHARLLNDQLRQTNGTPNTASLQEARPATRLTVGAYPSPSPVPEVRPLSVIKEDVGAEQKPILISGANKKKPVLISGSRMVPASLGQHQPHQPQQQQQQQQQQQHQPQQQQPLLIQGPRNVEDLQIGPGPFDPRQPNIQSQIVAKLGLCGMVTIEAVGGFTGGRNEGVWILRHAAKSEQYVLKLISCHRIHHSMPTETENFVKLSKEFPGLGNDREVAFPLKLFACQTPGRPRTHDLIVMRIAPGQRLAEVLHFKWGARAVQDIMKIMRCCGQALKRFHMRYRNTQHQDFQPANIFWDEATETVTLIDLGGMGLPTVGTDGDHFRKAFRQMTGPWGPMTQNGCVQSFDAGYNEVR